MLKKDFDVELAKELGYKYLTEERQLKRKGKFEYIEVIETWLNIFTGKFIKLKYSEDFIVIDEEMPDSTHYGCGDY